MNKEKQEELDKMYALRAGLSVISQKCDEIDDNRKNLKKKQLNLREIKEMCYYLYYGYTDNIIDNYSKDDKNYYKEIMSSSYYDDITVEFELYVEKETGTLEAFEDLQRKYKEYTKSWLSRKKYKNEIAEYERQIKKKLEVIEGLKTKHREQENQIKLFESKVVQENKKLEDFNMILYNSLLATYRNFLDIRDWENLDLIIYYYETGRADSIKEALQLVDNERRNNALIEAIGIATTEICRSIQSLGNVIIQGFASLSAQIEAQRVQITDAMSEMVTQQTLSNALLEKANVSSKEMVEQMKKLNTKVK